MTVIIFNNMVNVELFEYWLKRKTEILLDNNFIWRGINSAFPDVLHKSIDEEIDKRRPFPAIIPKPSKKKNNIKFIGFQGATDEELEHLCNFGF